MTEHNEHNSSDLLLDNELLDSINPRTIDMSDGNFDNLNITNCNIICYNINSLTHGERINELKHISKTIEPKFLAIVESKLDDSVSENIYKIPGYSCEHRHRNRHGGGIVLYISNNIPYVRLKNIESKHVEHLSCEAIIHNEKYQINVIYRPPNELPADHDNFLNNMEETLQQIKTIKADKRILVGDFNFGSSYCHSGSLRPKPLDDRAPEIFTALGFNQLIDIPTRYGHDNSISLIDLIYTDNITNLITSATLPQLADHLGTLVSFTTLCPTKQVRSFLKFNYDMANWNNIEQDLIKLQDPMIYDTQDVDKLTEMFSDVLINTRKENVPTKTVIVREGDLPWQTKDIKKLLRKQYRLHKQYTQNALKLKTDNTLNEIQKEVQMQKTNRKLENYRKASRQYEYAVRKEKCKYFAQLKQTLCSPSVSSQKKFQKINQVTNNTKNEGIPPIIDNQQVIHEPLRKAELFNEMFAAKSKVDGADDPVPELEQIDTHHDLSDIRASSFEIGHIITNLKKSNYSPCSIPSNYLILLYNRFGSKITKPISNLLNCINKNGIYPTIWKTQNITPVFKMKGAKSDKSMYRPISILSTLSKICESVLHNRILGHLEDNNLITTKQSAYLKGDSCSQQLLYIVHNIKKAWAHSQISHACYLDIQGAFDCVWHKAMLAKLKQINIKGSLHKLLTSYLSNRKARTNIEGIFSSLLDILAGVPQGSRLGPLLFIIYINDIINNLETDSTIFADDTTLMATAEDPAQTSVILNRDLERIFLWSKKWKLVFNPSKTYDMVFAKKTLNNSPPLVLDSVNITRINKHKHLGIYLTSDLSWDYHLTQLVKKVNLRLSNFYRNKLFSRNTLDILYKMNIRSLIDYGCQVWGPCLNDTQIAKLEKTQYRAAKIVTGAMYRTSSAALRGELGWESIKDRINLLSLTHFNKIQTNMTRPLIQSCLPPRNNNILDLRTTRLYIPFPEKDRGFNNSFFPKMANLWDNLPSECKSGSSFKEQQENLSKHFKPTKYKLNSYGTKLGNKLHTQIRLSQSQLNAHLYTVGLSDTKSCECGAFIEDTYHFIFKCSKYILIRDELLNNLDGVLSKKINSYSKNALKSIFLFGENPDDPERIPYNRVIFRRFQNFLMKSKRLVYKN